MLAPASPALSTASPTRLYFPVPSAPGPDGQAGAHHGGPGGYDALPLGTSLAAFCLDVDALRPQYLAHKRAIVRRPGRGPLRMDGQATLAAVSGAEVWLRARMLELPQLRHDAARLSGMKLDELVMELQEDLVLMHLAPGHAPERTRALYMHVCFPGGWNPAALLGKSFTALHARVPYETGFGRSDRAEHAAALFRQPLARYVWSVTPEPTLDRHPETPRLLDWSRARTLYLRVERQIMLPLSWARSATAPDELQGELSLFFIRTYVYERTRLSQAQRATLLQAVADMSEPMRRYKGMLGQEAAIARWLSEDPNAEG